MSSSTDSDADIVYVPARGRGGPVHYHTDPDCEKLNRADNTYEKRRDLIDGDTEACSICTGDFEQSCAGPDSGYADDLSQMDPEDLGLSPKGERRV